MSDDKEARYRELEPKTVYEERESNSHMSYSLVNEMREQKIGGNNFWRMAIFSVGYS